MPISASYYHASPLFASYSSAGVRNSTNYDFRRHRWPERPYSPDLRTSEPGFFIVDEASYAH